MKTEDIIGAIILWIPTILIWLGIWLDRKTLGKAEEELREAIKVREQVQKMLHEDGEGWKYQ